MTVVRVVWSRGKKHAKTQAKILSGSLDKAVFEEKFQINTLLELDPETGHPIKEKISKMTIQLDKSMGELPIAEAEFNMADFVYGEYNPIKLNLKQSPENKICDIDPNETYLSIGLKGTRSNNIFYDKRNAQNLRPKPSRSAMDTTSDNRTLNDRASSINSMQSQEIER